MHKDANEWAGVFGGLAPGDRLGPMEVTVSAAGNERYWRSAGVDHPLLAAGVLYPPIAANLLIMLVRAASPHEVLHTAQRVRAHCLAAAGSPVVTTAVVTERFAKRGREYVTLDATVTTPDGVVIWDATGTFCQA